MLASCCLWFCCWTVSAARHLIAANDAVRYVFCFLLVVTTLLLCAASACSLGLPCCMQWQAGGDAGSVLAVFKATAAAYAAQQPKLPRKGERNILVSSRSSSQVMPRWVLLYCTCGYTALVDACTLLAAVSNQLYLTCGLVAEAEAPTAGAAPPAVGGVMVRWLVSSQLFGRDAADTNVRCCAVNTCVLRWPQRLHDLLCCTAGDVSAALCQQRAPLGQHHRLCAECRLLRALLQEQGLQHHLCVRHRRVRHSHGNQGVSCCVSQKCRDQVPPYRNPRSRLCRFSKVCTCCFHPKYP
jgi:hypothetical protein